MIMWTVIHMIKVTRFHVHGGVCHGCRPARRWGYDGFKLYKTIIPVQFSQAEQCGYFGADVSRLWTHSDTNANSSAHTDVHTVTDGYAIPNRNANRRAYGHPHANNSAHTATDSYAAPNRNTNRRPYDDTHANSSAHTDAHTATDGYAAPNRNTNRRAYGNSHANSKTHYSTERSPWLAVS